MQCKTLCRRLYFKRRCAILMEKAVLQGVTILYPNTARRSSFFNRLLSNPPRVIVISFALLILSGTFLLMLPVSSKSGIVTPFADALFTATSATCVTGLVVRDTATYFSGFGQGIILALIQFGGLGLVSFAAFFNIAIRKKTGLKGLQVARESVNSSDAGSDLGRLLTMLFSITLMFELAGAVILSFVLIPQFGVYGIFQSLFVSVSAYCNAGFDLFGILGPYSSMTPFYSNPLVLITVSVLIISGGLGLVVWEDFYHLRKRHKLLLHTRIVLIATAVLLVSGTVLIAALEWNNPATIGGMHAGEKILNSFFTSVSARTAGFNSFSIVDMTGLTKLLMIFLMFIGAAPGSTGGGIKVTTFYVLIMTVCSALAGKTDPVIRHRRVDKSIVYKSLAIVAVAIAAVIVCTATIVFTSDLSGLSEIDAIFESVSAFATVGLSAGVTETASRISRLTLILAMFLGRVGPMSLALSMTMRPLQKNTVMPEAKIMVG